MFRLIPLDIIVYFHKAYHHYKVALLPSLKKLGKLCKFSRDYLVFVFH